MSAREFLFNVTIILTVMAIGAVLVKTYGHVVVDACGDSIKVLL